LVRKVKGFIEVFLTLVRFQPFAQKQGATIVFYDRFAELCSERNISANKAATDIGLSNSTVTKWKKTGAVPQTATLSKIAEYFNVSMNYSTESSWALSIDGSNVGFNKNNAKFTTSTIGQGQSAPIQIYKIL
jgi:transcriptional regulator with XRE-family HTH domain